MEWASNLGESMGRWVGIGRKFLTGMYREGSIEVE